MQTLVCQLAACQLYVLQKPLDVSPGGGPSSENPCLEGRGRGSCTMRSDASWMMVIWDPSPVNRQTDMTENIIFPQASLAGFNIIEVYEKPVPRTKTISHHAAKFEAREENRIVFRNCQCNILV